MENGEWKLDGRSGLPYVSDRRVGGGAGLRDYTGGTSGGGER